MLLGVFACVALPGATPAAADRWQRRGDGLDAEAVWASATGDARLLMRCDRGSPRIDLRLTSGELPPDLQRLTLVADDTAMDYPLEKAATDGVRGYRAKIALDAPILDRMLVARSFTVLAGGRVVQTGVPGNALARIVRTCREHHWPREARIDPSDAGLAK